jgi:hypothetical protein
MGRLLTLIYLLVEAMMSVDLRGETGITLSGR